MKALNQQAAATGIPRHPFGWLPTAIRSRALAFALLLTVALMGAILTTNTPLVNPTAPYGMVSFQLAGNLTDTQTVLSSWNPQARVFAALNLGIDYLYMVAYTVTISLACALLASHLAHRGPLLALVGVGVSWVMFVALLLDAAENYFLIRLLLGDGQTLWPVLARWCAIPKFGLVLAALVYLASGGLLAIIKNTKKKPS